MHCYMLCCDVISVYMLVIVFCIVYMGSSPMYKVLAIILALVCAIYVCYAVLDCMYGFTTHAYGSYTL